MKTCPNCHIEYEDKFVLCDRCGSELQVFSFFENKPPFTLPWSHYLVLMRIENENEGL